MLQNGDLVPGALGKQVACPLLAPGAQYVGFNGNGWLRGQGYRLFGTRDTGWAAKCGYPVLEGATKRRQIARGLLADLAGLPEAFGLVAVGLNVRTGRWYGLDELRQLAISGQQWEELDGLLVRFYGPEDFLERWRGHYQAQGGFIATPQTVSGDGASTVTGARLRQAGIKQRALAKQLGVSPGFVSQLLNEQRSWPQDLQQRALGFVRARELSMGGSQRSGVARRTGS
jgi:hypothetical protein